MLLKSTRLLVGWSIVSIGITVFAQQPLPAVSSWQPVEQALGSPGALQSDGVFKIWMPRHDLKVTVKAQPIVPVFALESWVAFQRIGKDTLMRGELVLMPDEVGIAMDRLQDSGIKQTGLHQFLFYESPRVVALRISSRGDPIVLANAIKMALKGARVPAKPSTEQEDVIPLDKLGMRGQEIEAVLGTKGEIIGRVLRFFLARPERIVENGVEIPPAMGSASVINFMSSDEGKVALAGELVLLPSEVAPVTQSMRNEEMEIVGLYNCFLAEEPRLFCLRFWASGEAEKLTRGMRAVLDKTHLKGSTSK